MMLRGWLQPGSLDLFKADPKGPVAILYADTLDLLLDVLRDIAGGPKPEWDHRFNLTVNAALAKLAVQEFDTRAAPFRSATPEPTREEEPPHGR